ncbi:MAG TPA: GNAT family N-acetyltransferase [Rudaea sp.]|jgi:GNAT superfamily N-acetyltransferase|nr:GNAT family N-acetyltransferase [Rudaea sp.]HSC09747.1 GNAT family N-acetyltransferase [Rhodanobacteraceae bacterium]
MSALQGAISIRPARSDDVASLAGLSTQLGYPATADMLSDRLMRVRDEGVGQVFVAADAHGRVLGWTHVVPRLHLEESPFAELAGLVVGEGARGAGVGAALLSAAEQWAREHGFAHFRVRSNVVRERAHRFYLREGYVERKRQVVFDKTLD